ncbi:MAG TPA: flavin reductase family protein [Chloroflexota bacterium]|nr:flavin reductase family protein [Chloroflexota bacterium]
MKIAVPLNLALRMIVSGPVSLVTTAFRGQYDVATMSWLAPVGREPPLLAIAVYPSSVTHDFLKRSGEFVVNIPTRDVINQVVSCGIVSGAQVDKFKTTGLTMVEAQVLRPPVIEQCIGHLECAVVNAYQPGDHTIFVGQVAYAMAEEDAFDEAWKLEEAYLKPLHHLGGYFFGALEERIDATPAEVKAKQA